MEPIAFGRRLSATTDINELLGIAAEVCAALAPEGIAVVAVQRPPDGSWHVRAKGPTPESAETWAERLQHRIEKRPASPTIGAHGQQPSWPEDTATISVLEAEVDGGDAGSGLLALIRTQSGASVNGGAIDVPLPPETAGEHLPAVPRPSDGTSDGASGGAPVADGRSAVELQHEVATIAALSGAALRTAMLAVRLSQQERDQQEQQRYFSLIAHDLRTPLAAIRGYAQLLLRQRNVSLNPLQHSGLETIIQQSDRLAGQTEKMLDIARIQARRLALRLGTADVGQIVRQAAGAIRSGPGSPPIEVTAPQSGPLIQADSMRCTQMVQGLLEFAIGRTDGQQPITVRVAADSGGVSLAVEEHGPPLSPGERDGLFRRLLAETPEGTSPSLAHIGLYIVRGAAEAHGGRAWAESPLPDSEVGVRLIVWLPVRHEP